MLTFRSTLLYLYTRNDQDQRNEEWTALFVWNLCLHVFLGIGFWRAVFHFRNRESIAFDTEDQGKQCRNKVSVRIDYCLGFLNIILYYEVIVFTNIIHL